MSDILIHTADGVTTITLNRVEKKNSFTQAMYAACADALEAAKDDAAVRVVVFQGDVAIFSAGNDIGDFLNNPPGKTDAPVFRFLRGIAEPAGVRRIEAITGGAAIVRVQEQRASLEQLLHSLNTTAALIFAATLKGCIVITGAALRESVAVLLDTLPAALVTTTS